MKLLEFPSLRQTFNYDCGTKVLQAILTYYGIEVRSDKLMKSANTTSEGTFISGMLKTLRKYGLQYTSKRMTIDEIKAYIEAQKPVIISLQAYPEKKVVRWEDDWENGHYVVAIGFDEKNVYFEDPSSFYHTYLSYEELACRWHSKDSGDRKYIHHGIAVYGKKPVFRRRAIHHMD